MNEQMRKAFEEKYGRPMDRHSASDAVFSAGWQAALAIQPQAPQGAVTGWQLIESAPKDGTEILGWREDAGAFIMRWIAPINFMTERELEESSDFDDEWQELEDWFYADFVQGGRLDGSEAPTHWQPIPAAPETPEELK